MNSSLANSKENSTILRARAVYALENVLAKTIVRLHPNLVLQTTTHALEINNVRDLVFIPVMYGSHFFSLVSSYLQRGPVKMK